jgi:drug/metabolite transporter (DMT)-like permease
MENTIIRVSKVHVALLLLMSILIGSMFPLLKIAEESIPPLTLTMLRALLATMVMFITVGLVMRRSLVPLRTYWKTFAFLGLLLSLFFTSISEAEESISASLGAVMVCIVPLVTFLITTLLMRWEKFSWQRFAGTIVALAGVVMFIGTESLSSGRSQWAGVSIIGGGYILYAVNLIVAKYRDLDPFLTATGTLLFATLFMALAAFGLEQPLAIEPSAKSLLAAAVVGIFSTGMTYLLLYYLVAYAGPVFAATSGYIIPIVTLLLGHFMLSESMDSAHMAGMALTLLGAWLVNRNV